MSERMILDEETDAVVADKAESTWITIKNFSVYVVKTDEGIVVDIYAKGCEDCDTLASTYAFDTEAADMQEDNEEDK